MGLGSVGQRHLQNLRVLVPDTEVIALRTGRSQRVIKDGEYFDVDDLGDYYGIDVVTSLEEARDRRPDVAFITNPSALHVRIATDLALADCHLFIEKPLGTDLQGVDELERIVGERNLVTFVGFQTRFNPLYRQAKGSIDLEKVISAGFEWSTYLPAHHPWEDYSQGYAAREDLGGGVVLCLIHELDLIYDLLGMPTDVMAMGGRLSDLNMTAQDTVCALLGFRFVRHSVPVMLHLTFAQPKEVRRFRFQLTDRTVFLDLTNNELEIYDESGERIIHERGDFSRNDLFMNELSYFLECVRKKEQTFLPVSEGRRSLEIALAIKERILECEQR